eukprot:5442429-Pleurochrysis_carterae.AAC.5
MSLQVSEQSADLDKEIAKLREENLSLKTKLDDFDHVHAGANPKHQQAEEHAAMLGLKLLCSNLLEIDARLVQLRTSAELWEERVSTLRSTERLQISQISTYESKRAEFSETLVSSSSVFASLDEQCAKHKSRTEELNAENVKMSAKLTGAPARRAAMRQKIAALEQEMRDLARERDEIAAECRNLQASARLDCARAQLPRRHVFSESTDWLPIRCPYHFHSRISLAKQQYFHSFSLV